MMRYSLEVAAATNNLCMLEELYTRASNSPGIERDQFTDMIENTLYWAVIGRNEEIVGFILERAFAYAYAKAPELNVERVGSLALSLTARASTPEDRLVFVRIRENLATIPRLLVATSRSHMREALSRLASILPLPTEIIALILSFVLRHKNII